MEIIFGTTEKWRALEYLERALPNYIINKETAKVVLDMIDEGKIRIGDPYMYGGRLPIFPEKNYTAEDGEKLKKWKTNLQKKTEE